MRNSMGPLGFFLGVSFILLGLILACFGDVTGLPRLAINTVALCSVIFGILIQLVVLGEFTDQLNDEAENILALLGEKSGDYNRAIFIPLSEPQPRSTLYYLEEEEWNKPRTLN